MNSKKLRILQVITGTSWSGGQQQTLHLLKGLREMGHESFLACPPSSLLGSRAREEGIPVKFIPMRSEADIPSIWSLYRLMKKEKIDVVNAQRPTAHTLAMVASVLAGVPVFIATRRVSVRLSSFFSSKIKYSLADRIISVSDGVKKVLIDCGVPEEVITTVYSGSDITRFNNALSGRHIREEFGIPHNVPLIGMVGNVKEQKGQFEFIRSSRHILSEVPDARFILVGHGAEKKIIEKIDREMLPYFTCTGFREDIPEIFAAMDVHVNSATGFDGLAGTIREGLAMGKPTVATDVAGHREIVIHMDTGLLVPPGDEKAFVTAVVRLIRDSTLAARLGTRGMEYVINNFSEPVMVRRTEAVYREVLASKGKM